MIIDSHILSLSIPGVETEKHTWKAHHGEVQGSQSRGVTQRCVTHASRSDRVARNHSDYVMGLYKS